MSAAPSSAEHLWVPRTNFAPPRCHTTLTTPPPQVKPLYAQMGRKPSLFGTLFMPRGFQNLYDTGSMWGNIADILF